MYPNFYYIFKDWFGVEWHSLQVINSFGFFVALSFIAAASTLAIEFKRKQKQGFLHPLEEKRWVGQKASLAELAGNFLLGFIFGYKLLGVLFRGNTPDSDPQEYLFSMNGNLLLGLIMGFLFSGLRWYEKNKTRLEKPEERIVRIWPHDRVGDITMVAALFGFLGAKLFDNLEHWDEFVRDPVGSFFSASGLTFYGGLIVAAVAVIFYCRSKKIDSLHLIDAAAPGLTLAYAIGRIGCHVSGDGDWGIPNPDPNPFSWLPNWMWSYDYPHNVNSAGVPLPDCTDLKFCNHLVPPVYPTPLYESIVGLLLFFLLWSIRKKIKAPGALFGLYLVVNGMERFSIEQIRVNVRYSFWGLHYTQAEFIAAGLVLGGLLFYFWAVNKRKKESRVAEKHS